MDYVFLYFFCFGNSLLDVVFLEIYVGIFFIIVFILEGINIWLDFLVFFVFSKSDYRLWIKRDFILS